MGEWQSRYAQKVSSAPEAVAHVRSGAHVFIGSGCAEPEALVHALADRGRELFDVELLHILTLGIAPYADARFSDAFRHNALFIGQNVRDAIREGRADYTPVFLSEVPRLFASGRVPVDVALIEVSPPDADGVCSYGLSVDVVKSATAHASLVIAEVNAQMPRTLGDAFIHVDEVDWLVPTDTPIPELPPPEPNEIADRIGHYVASLVDDGSTLQMGIGAIPHAVLAQLGDKHDLGVHSEMISDSVIPLVEGGVITNRLKTCNPGMIVTSFAMGTRALYAFVDNNPRCAFHPTEYTNDPFVIAEHDKMVAINSALQVDLTGQVCSDSIGSEFYSGIGGQVDFMRGAARSRDGKPIIVVPSMTEDGGRSRIVPTLAEGSGVVTSRGDVHYVVTEWGIADLYGKTVRERAMELINVAHPDVRSELLAAAKARRYVYPDQASIPDGAAVYPEHWETTMTTKDGRELHVRPIRATDEEALQDLFYRCSDDTIYRRYLGPMKSMPHSRVQFFTTCDYVDRFAIVAVLPHNERDEFVGIASYGRDESSPLVDAAWLVRDDFQNAGVGRFLVNYIIRIAEVNGLPGVRAEVLGDNPRMLHLLQTCDWPTEMQLERGVYELRIVFPSDEPAPTE